MVTGNRSVFLGPGTNCKGKWEISGATDMLLDVLLTVVVVTQLYTITKMYPVVHLENMVEMKRPRGVSSRFRSLHHSQAVFEWLWFPVNTISRTKQYSIMLFRLYFCFEETLTFEQL